MSELGWTALAVLVGWAGIALLRRRREGVRSEAARPRAAKPAAAEDDDAIDYQMLAEAEREVQDLDADAKGRPLDNAIGDDWGPGTPKPPYV